MDIKKFRAYISEGAREDHNEVIEEAVSSGQIDSVAKLVASYLGRKLGTKFIRLPGVEQYKNSNESGFGIRYFFGKAQSVRFNWKDMSLNSAALRSVDIWTGKGSDIDHHVTFNTNVSLVKTLPMIADILKAPKNGMFRFMLADTLNEDFEETNGVMLSEAFLVESTDPDLDAVIATFKKGEVIDNAAFGRISSSAYGISLAIKKAYPELFTKSGRSSVYIGDPDFFIKNRNTLAGRIGRVKATVSKGGSGEKYTPSPQVLDIEANRERIAFEMQLKDLEHLTQLVAAGASNALFVAGRGGVGKTHTVETTLESMGLKDGAGFFKNTGSASPVGIYIMLYQNRNGIVLFDDSDGALADQDGRNLIKAATDTKRIRKLAWTKKSSSFVDPLPDGEEYEEGTYPKYFDFKGRVIFISNLSINKLDPDGALRTRALMIDVDPTDQELIDFMRKLAPTFKLEEGMHLSIDERLEVVDLFAHATSKSGLSLRKLERGLNMRAALGKNGDWARMIRLYA